MKILIQKLNPCTIIKNNFAAFCFTCCLMLLCTYNISAQGTIGEYPGSGIGFDSGCGYPNAGSVATPITVTFAGGVCGSSYVVTYGGLIETADGFDITGFTLSNYDIDTAAVYGFRIFYGPQNNCCTICMDAVLDLSQNVPCGTFGTQPDLSVFGYPVPLNFGEDAFGKDIILYENMCPNTEYFVQYQFFEATDVDLTDPDGNLCAMDDNLITDVGPSALGTVVAPGTRPPIAINSADLTLVNDDCTVDEVVLDFTADITAGCTTSFGNCSQGLEYEFRAVLSCTDGTTLNIGTGPLVNDPTGCFIGQAFSGQISLGTPTDICDILTCDPNASLELYATHTYCEADDINGDGSGVDEAALSVPLASVLSECDCSDVFPGDYNTDGTVNTDDALYWGLAEGFTGAVRSNATTDCIPQACANWSQSVDGINSKHQDGDGNGVVDDQDLQVVVDNFGCTQNPPIPLLPINNPIYRIQPQGIIAGKYQYTVYAENGAGAAATAHGLAFTVTSDAIPISAVTMSTTDSSLNPDEVFAILDGNQCHAVLTRIDGFDVVCAAPIATFLVSIADVPADVLFRINITSGSKIKADATLDRVTGATAFGMSNGIGPSSSNLLLNASVTHEQCNGPGGAIVIPSGGTEPYTYAWSTGADSPQVTNLASGTYTVTVTDANGINQSLTLQINGQTPIYDASGNLLCGNLCPVFLAPSGFTTTGLYSADHSIDADATVPTGNNTEYTAGQVIKLDQGFTVQPNAEFSAEIEDCNEN